MKLKKLFIMIFILALSFIGMMGIKADLGPTSENESNGKPYYYYGGDCDRDLCKVYAEWLHDIDNDGDDYLVDKNKEKAFLEAGIEAAGFRIGTEDKVCYGDVSSKKVYDKNGNDVTCDAYFIRVSSTRRFYIGSQEVFCLDGITQFVVGKTDYSKKGNTAENEGVACALVEIYGDPNIGPSLKFDDDNKLILSGQNGLSNEIIWTIQQKIWSHQYDNADCTSDEERTIEREVTSEITISKASGADFTLNKTLGKYVSVALTVSATNIEPGKKIVLEFGGAGPSGPDGTILSTSSTEVKEVPADGLESGSKVYIMVPASAVTKSETIRLNANAYIKHHEEIYVTSSFQKYESESGSQLVGIPNVVRKITPIYEQESRSINLTLAPNNQKTIKISKQDIASEKEIPGAKICVYKYNTTSKEKGDEVECFVSEETPHEFSLEPGNYALEEVVTPEGYEEIKTIFQFSIGNDMKIKLEGAESDNIKIDEDNDDTIIFYNVPKKVEVPDTKQMAKVVLWVIGISLVCGGAALICTKLLNKKENA